MSNENKNNNNDDYSKELVAGVCAITLMLTGAGIAIMAYDRGLKKPTADENIFRSLLLQARKEGTAPIFWDTPHGREKFLLQFVEKLS